MFDYIAPNYWMILGAVLKDLEGWRSGMAEGMFRH